MNGQGRGTFYETYVDGQVRIGRKRGGFEASLPNADDVAERGSAADRGSPAHQGFEGRRGLGGEVDSHETRRDPRGHE